MKEQGKLAFGILGAFAVAFVISGCLYLEGAYKIYRQKKASEAEYKRFFGHNKNSSNKEKEVEPFPLDVIPNVAGDKYVPINYEEEFKKLGIENFLPKEEDKVTKQEDVKDKSGNIIGKKEYTKGGKVIVTITDNGKIVSTTTGVEKDGKLDGEVTVVYPGGGKDVYTYKKGIRSGKAILYFSNGDREESIYDNDKMNGKATYFFKNGDKEEYIYKDGIIDGDAQYIYANGTKESYKYVNGERQ